MSQMNPSVDNSMRNHNPWLTSNSVGIQTWLNGPQIPAVSAFSWIKSTRFLLFPVQGKLILKTNALKFKKKHDGWNESEKLIIN